MFGYTRATPLSRCTFPGVAYKNNIYIIGGMTAYRTKSRWKTFTSHTKTTNGKKDLLCCRQVGGSGGTVVYNIRFI